MFQAGDSGNGRGELGLLKNSTAGKLASVGSMRGCPTRRSATRPPFDSAQGPGRCIPVDGRNEHYWTVGLGHTVPCNLTGHPAVTCPIGLADDGLPVGVQAVGRRWGDMELLRFVEALAAFVGPTGHPTA